MTNASNDDSSKDPPHTDRLRRLTGSSSRPRPSPPETSDVDSEGSGSTKPHSSTPNATGEKSGPPAGSSTLPIPPSDESPLEDLSSEADPEGSFPKKIGTNEWLHADGHVYKKLMFVIRKDQSEALDVLLASGDRRLGSDRSEVVRTLLDRNGIKSGGSGSD